MDRDVRQRNRRRARAQRLKANTVKTVVNGDETGEDEFLPKSKPPRPLNRRRKRREPLYEEDIIDGFAIASFSTYHDLERAVKHAEKLGLGKLEPLPSSTTGRGAQTQARKAKRPRNDDSASSGGYFCDHSASDDGKVSDSGSGVFFVHKRKELSHAPVVAAVTNGFPGRATSTCTSLSHPALASTATLTSTSTIDTSSAPSAVTSLAPATIPAPSTSCLAVTSSTQALPTPANSAGVSSVVSSVRITGITAASSMVTSRGFLPHPGLSTYRAHQPCTTAASAPSCSPAHVPLPLHHLQQRNHPAAVNRQAPSSNSSGGGRLKFGIADLVSPCVTASAAHAPVISNGLATGGGCVGGGAVHKSVRPAPDGVVGRISGGSGVSHSTQRQFAASSGGGGVVAHSSSRSSVAETGGMPAAGRHHSQTPQQPQQPASQSPLAARMWSGPPHPHPAATATAAVSTAAAVNTTMARSLAHMPYLAMHHQRFQQQQQQQAVTVRTVPPSCIASTVTAADLSVASRYPALHRPFSTSSCSSSSAAVVCDGGMRRAAAQPAAGAKHASVSGGGTQSYVRQLPPHQQQQQQQQHMSATWRMRAPHQQYYSGDRRDNQNSSLSRQGVSRAVTSPVRLPGRVNELAAVSRPVVACGGATINNNNNNTAVKLQENSAPTAGPVHTALHATPLNLRQYSTAGNTDPLRRDSTEGRFSCGQKNNTPDALQQHHHHATSHIISHRGTSHVLPPSMHHQLIPPPATQQPSPAAAAASTIGVSRPGVSHPSAVMRSGISGVPSCSSSLMPPSSCRALPAPGVASSSALSSLPPTLQSNAVVPAIRKEGRWNSMHVRIAWQIFRNQQRQQQQQQQQHALSSFSSCTPPASSCVLSASRRTPAAAAPNSSSAVFPAPLQLTTAAGQRANSLTVTSRAPATASAAAAVSVGAGSITARRTASSAASVVGGTASHRVMGPPHHIPPVSCAPVGGVFGGGAPVLPPPPSLALSPHYATGLTPPLAAAAVQPHPFLTPPAALDAWNRFPRPALAASWPNAAPVTAGAFSLDDRRCSGVPSSSSLVSHPAAVSSAAVSAAAAVACRSVSASLNSKDLLGVASLLSRAGAGVNNNNNAAGFNGLVPAHPSTPAPAGPAHPPPHHHHHHLDPFLAMPLLYPAHDPALAAAAAAAIEHQRLLSGLYGAPQPPQLPPPADAKSLLLHHHHHQQQAAAAAAAGASSSTASAVAAAASLLQQHQHRYGVPSLPPSSQQPR